MSYTPKYIPYNKTIPELKERYLLLRERIRVVFDPVLAKIESEQDLSEKFRKGNEVTNKILEMTEPVRNNLHKINQNLPRGNFEIVDREIESCREQLNILESKIIELEQQSK